MSEWDRAGPMNSLAWACRRAPGLGARSCPIRRSSGAGGGAQHHPLRASRGTWQAIRSLGTRPLAELLYADPSVERSVLVNRRLTARHPLHRYAARWTDARVTSLVARRSVFERHRTPLLVTECMLPALWQRLVAPHQTPTAHLHGAHHVGPVRLGTRLSQAPAKAQGAGEIADGPRRPR